MREYKLAKVSHDPQIRKSAYYNFFLFSIFGSLSSSGDAGGEEFGVGSGNG